MLAFGSPLCSETFQLDPTAYVRRIQTLPLMGFPSEPFMEGTPHE